MLENISMFEKKNPKNDCTVEIWEWINNFTTHFTGHGINYLSMLGLKLIHVKQDFDGALETS